ncbi:MAG: CoA transferase [Myxococcota bacterium]|nr:CoA transferase [Myxococcota bacterium]
MSALDGVRVIELSSERVAFAGKLLGDMGADVVVVEPPGGDPSRGHPPFLDDEPGPERSLFWWHYNTSKRGVTLDLESEPGGRLFRRLVETADVLIEGERPGRLAALGLDYPDLAALRGGLVHVSVTPFGRDGPRRHEHATDLTVLAGGGPVWNNGYDDHTLPPIRGGGNQGTQTACHYAVMSVLTALLYRGVSGEGQFVDVSMHAAANVTTEAGSYNWLVERSTVQRQTGRHAGPSLTLPSQVRCADGRYVNTGVPPRFPDEFRSLLSWMQELGVVEELPEAVFLELGAQKDFIDLSQIGKDDEVTAIFGAGREALNLIASKLSAYDFFVGAQRAGLAVGVIYSPEEAYEDPHFQARGFQVEVEHPELERSFRYPGAPYRLGASPWRISRRAPTLGEHNDAVWGELGLGPEELGRLREAGVL